MIMLSQQQPLNLVAIEQEIRIRYPDLHAAVSTTDTNVAALDVKDGQLILGNMPAPIPWSDLEGPCASSFLWKNATEEVRGHKGHIVVTIMSELEPVERTILLTQCTAAVLAACESAIGVYRSSLIVPKHLFLDFTREVLPLGPPLDIWIDFRVGWQTKTTSGGFTQGMEALGHMELEVVESPEKPAELRKRLQGLAEYLLESGAVIRDGDTVGQDAKEKIRVVYSDSAFGNTNRVMRLQYESAPQRPWWKLI